MSTGLTSRLPFLPSPSLSPIARITQDELTNHINAWLANQSSAHSTSTYVDALRRVNRIVPYSKVLLIDLVSARIVYKKLCESYSPATIHLTISAMSSLWRYLMSVRVVATNPWSGVRMPTPKDTLTERILTEQEVESIIDAADGRDQVFLRFLYATGCRIAEATSVSWEDVRWDEDGRAWLRVYGKGGKTRTVELPLTVASDLVETQEGPCTGRLFPFSPRTGERIVEKYRGAVGKGVSPHWFRHARATHAVRHGAPIDMVQRTLGHANVSTTMRYVHAMPGETDAGYVPDL